MPKLAVPAHQSLYFFLPLDLDAGAFEDTLAARDVDADVALLAPFTALIFLFCSGNTR